MDVYAEDEELPNLHVNSFAGEGDGSGQGDLGGDIFVFLDGVVYEGLEKGSLGFVISNFLKIKSELNTLTL